MPKTADIDADVAAGMELLKSRLEAGIGANPDQWVLFQRAWPLAPAPPVRVFPVGSPLESDASVDAVLPPSRDGRLSRPADAPTGRTDLPPQSRSIRAPTGSAPGTKTSPSTSGACRRERPTAIGSLLPNPSSASPTASISTCSVFPTSTWFLRSEIACCASMIALRRSSQRVPAPRAVRV